MWYTVTGRLNDLKRPMDSNIKNIFKKPAESQNSRVLNPTDLLRHAAAIIRFDKEAALNAQKDVTDMATLSNDQSIPKTTISLENMTSHRGGVSISDRSKLESNKSTPPENIVTFSNRKKDQ
jgi:hypothetical protein